MIFKGFNTFIKDITNLIIYIVLFTSSILQANETSTELSSSSGVENKEDKVVYYPEYFEIYSPHSAIDMIN